MHHGSVPCRRVLVHHCGRYVNAVADAFFFSPDAQADAKRDAPLKQDQSSSNAETTKPLAPPPRPAQQQGTNTPDYFSNPVAGSLSLEPNPFEQSFGGAPPETPGGTKLPSVAALTSPSSLLPGGTPYPWGGNSLRSGPLSPAMLSGPTNDYFSDTHHIRGFPTPNESSLRTGLTPGGSGSMFPAPSPNSQALFGQLAGPAPTPSTIDFHRTALSAAAAKREQAQAEQQSLPAAPTSQPQDMNNGTQPVKAEPKAPTGPFDPHDNDAANGLYMLAQGRNSAQPLATQQYPAPPLTRVHANVGPSAAPAAQPANTSPQPTSAAGGSARGGSEASAPSDENEAARPNTRGKGKRSSGGSTANSRRKAEDAPAKAPATKKTKTENNDQPEEDANNNNNNNNNSNNSNTGNNTGNNNNNTGSGNKGGKEEGTTSKAKMTDEEKRRNFLERNRYAGIFQLARQKAE